MTTDITGRRDNIRISRDGLQRNVTRHAVGIAGIALGGWIFTTGALAYVASLPREVPVVLIEHANGTIIPSERVVTPDEVAKEKLLADWIGSCRVGSGDPASMPARQCSALIPSVAGNSVLQQAHEQSQIVADSALKVSVNVRSVTKNGSDGSYDIDWDEAQTVGTITTKHAMRAFVSVEYSPQYVELHNDPFLNPYGIFVSSIRTVDEGGGK